MPAESMFAESMLESGSIHPNGRGWATALSITIQSLLVAALVALPIFRPDALPLAVKGITSPVAYGTPNPPAEAPGRSRSPSRESELVAPRAIPVGPVIDLSPAEETPASCLPFCGNISGQRTGVVGIFHVPLPANPPVVPVKPPARPVVSQMELGGLISRIQPIYPSIAIQTRTEGTVLLRAVIDRQGRITQVQVLSGHPLLQNAARSAVERWQYRPYILNGQPVEVETQIKVNFKLAR